jgi:hypothetical protein
MSSGLRGDGSRSGQAATGRIGASPRGVFDAEQPVPQRVFDLLFSHEPSSGPGGHIAGRCEWPAVARKIDVRAALFETATGPQHGYAPKLVRREPRQPFVGFLDVRQQQRWSLNVIGVEAVVLARQRIWVQVSFVLCSDLPSRPPLSHFNRQGSRERSSQGARACPRGAGSMLQIRCALARHRGRTRRFSVVS